MAPERRFGGFGSFLGLPKQAGRPDRDVDFSVEALPEVPPNVTLVPGCFAETVPAFAARLDEPVAMIHVDCDLYASTRDALGPLAAAGAIGPGLVIVCDEGINYPTFAYHELLALYETVTRLGLDLEPLAVHHRDRGLGETLAARGDDTHPDMAADRRRGYLRQAAFVVREGPAASPPAPAALVERFARDFGAYVQQVAPAGHAAPG